MTATVSPSMIPVAGAAFVRPLTVGNGIRLYGSASGYVGLKPAAAAGSVDYTLPSSPPSADGQVLTGTTAGVMSWATVSGASPSGSGTELQYRASETSFGAITGSSWSGGVATLPTLAVSDLTAGRIPHAGTAGRLSDSPNLTFSANVLAVKGPGSSGTSTFRVNPASGSSYVQINDNGTMVINSDVSTGTIPLSILYNGSIQAQFLYSTVIFGYSVGSYPVSFGGGQGSINTASGDMKIGGYTDISLRPNTSGGGSGSGSVKVISGAAASKALIIQGAAAQTANLQEWQNSSSTVLAAVAASGAISSTVGISEGPVTFAVLNASTPTATFGTYRITDRGNRSAYPDGTNWRFVSDDAIIS